jgi:hypothetical protein
VQVLVQPDQVLALPAEPGVVGERLGRGGETGDQHEQGELGQPGAGEDYRRALRHRDVK